MWDVLGFGAVAVDDLVYLDTYPAVDSKAPIREERRDGGGLAGTALVAAARLGARTAFAGVLGDDALSCYTIEAFAREGVDCSQVKRQPGARPIHSVILVERSTGRRTVLYNTAGVVSPQIDDFRHAIAHCRVLFVDSTVCEFAREAVRLAHTLGIPVVADLDRLPDEAVLELTRQVDHLIVGITFGALATGRRAPAEIVRALYSPGHTACVVTDGPNGCWYTCCSTGAEIRHLPAFHVQAVDTNGCGDVFHGAYAASIARGEPVLRALTVAAATAGLKATRPGGRNGIPTRAAVEQFLDEQGISGCLRERS